MVLFGPISLQHVLDITIEKARSEIYRPIPLRAVNYRVDHADLGRAVKVAGEIRATTIPDATLALELLRRLRDGVTRNLDLEDGTTAAFTAKAGNLTSSISADGFFSGKYFVSYALEFLEA